MQLHECLSQVAERHPDMIFRNLAALNSDPKQFGTAAQMLEWLNDEPGYEVKVYGRGRFTKMVIRVSGMNILIEEKD